MLSRLALLGAEKGPCVSCRGIRRPHLKIVGLPEGASVTVKTSTGVEFTTEQNGLHSLRDTHLDWIEVSCSVSNRNTICEVVSTKAA